MTKTSEQVLSRGGMAPGVEHIARADVMTPADRYQELFVAVQQARIFADSKAFVDCVPLDDPAAILARYRVQQGQPDFGLADFVKAHFRAETVPDDHYVSDPNQTIAAHINSLWPVLTRHPHSHAAHGSLLPLPCPYVVPGGRFGEMYYWDSYFTMLGLAHGGFHTLMRNMADNFAFLIDTYGHIPNGNRSYYLSRSQPPVFALMVDLFEQHGIKRAVRYLPQLKAEYAYWMEGAEMLAPGEAHRYVVRMPDGVVLNRYWDERDTPREEGYLEDVQTAQRASRPAGEVYRDLRAGAASGWDFSSRWLADASDLSTIRTTAILPVDLNAFLFKLEMQISRLCAADEQAEDAARYRTLADARARAVSQHLWWQMPDGGGCFVDYDWQRREAREYVTAAAAVPLYTGMATQEQAVQVRDAIASRLLAPGGIVTTELETPQQWDRANGWAPLQWMAVGGLRRYGQRTLAHDIAHRWLDTVGKVYERESKLVEKYALHAASDIGVAGGGGGEYPLQDGFGWTNGVTMQLLNEHPTHPTMHRRAPAHSGR